jgi:hypothetical protein
MMTKPLLLLVGLVGIGVFVLGPDTGLGPAALLVGVALVVASGSAWLLRARGADAPGRDRTDPRVPPRR